MALRTEPTEHRDIDQHLQWTKH